MKHVEGREYFGDLGIDGNIILKEILKKYFLVVLPALI